MGKLIIVCGLPGSGKTTLAEALSRKLKITCLHKDTIKEKLYDSLNCLTLDDSKRMGKPSMDVVYAVAQQQLERGVDLILEAPFNFPEDYELFKTWQEKYDIEIISIECHIDWEERQRRFKEGERHSAHHDHERALKNIEHDYSRIPGRKIFIKTDEDANKLIEKIIKEINQ